MFPLLFADTLQYVFGILSCLTAVFLILLVLVQRGRGGGLAGAFGGMGGQSAFGTKAGDMFTRITIAVAAIWIMLNIAGNVLIGKQPGKFQSAPGATTTQELLLPEDPSTETSEPAASGEGGLGPSTVETDAGGTPDSAPESGSEAPSEP